MNMIGTVLVIFVVNYFSNFQVKLILTSRKMKGMRTPYPIKLFYTSNIPVIFQSIFVQNVFFLAQLLARKFRGNFVVSLIGKW